MRITARELHRNMLYVINDRYNELATLQNQIATGKRLQRPSDDPVDVANTLKLETKTKELLQFKKNINDGLAYMGVAETAMESMNTLLQRIRELSVQASSDTLSSDERMYINEETEQLFKQCIALVNTQYKGDYIFNGAQSKIPPYIISSSVSTTVDNYANLDMAYYDASTLVVGDTVQLRNAFDDSPVTNMIPGTFELNIAGVPYSENTDYTVDYEAGTLTILSPALLIDVSPGSANYDISQVNMNFDYITIGEDIYGQPVSNLGEISREIESGITMQINVSADEMTTDFSTGNTLIGSLIRFGQSLVQNDQNAIETSIGDIDSVFSAILSAQSENGARINRFETTLIRNENQYTETVSTQSKLEDAEMAETISQFMIAENVYNAALQSSAKIIQPSLVNFL